MALARGNLVPEPRHLEVAGIGSGRELGARQASDRILPHGTSLSPSIVSGLIAVADGAVMSGSGFLIYIGYLGLDGAMLPRYLSFLVLTTGFSLTGFSFAHLYDFEALTYPSRQLLKLVTLCAVAFMGAAAFAFALKMSAEFSRVWAFSWFVTATVLICLERASCYALLRKLGESGRLTRNVAIVGAGQHGRRLLEHLSRNGTPWIRILALFDDRSRRVPASIEGVMVQGNVDRLLQFAQTNRIDDVLVALPWMAEKRLLGIFHKLKVLPAHVQLAPDLIGFNLSRPDYERLSKISFLKVSAKPLAGWRFVLKTVEDRLLAALILVFILPLLVIIAVTIKLDSPGPVLFRQKRYGFNNQLIEVWKFRTMYHHLCDENAERLATRVDTRVTRLGAFLRRTSLDELPQFFNVLQGDMSIVGPRPHATAAKAADRLYSDVVTEYAVRHKVKPGITGWAQVNGWRGETDTEEKIRKRVEFDLRYIENWSLALDLWIIVRTLFVFFSGKSAY